VYCKRPSLAVLSFAGLLLAGCQQSKPVAEGITRTAVLRFENLSGGASEDWQGRALSELLQRRFGANQTPRALSPAPGISTERLAAINAGATRLIAGYFTASEGSLAVTAFVEDTVTQKLSGPFRATGSISAVAASLAKQLNALRPLSLNPDSPALKEYSQGRDTAGQEALHHYDLAFQADPEFGPAYLGALQTAAAGNDGPRAQAVLKLASAHSDKFAAEDRAYLQLESATLAHDAQGRAQALSALLATDPRDKEILKTLAEAEMSSHKAAEAASHYRQLAAASPADVNAQNLLAYSALFAGDEAGARTAALEYRRLSPQDPNAFDTQGDVEFGFGHFAEAEKFYLSSPDQAFQDYSPTWKAAHARYLAGDLPGANAIFEKHRALLALTSAPASVYRSAKWNYFTGHTDEATTAMAAFAAQSAQPEWRGVGFAQAAIWALVAKDSTHAAEWSDQALHPPQQATFAISALARFLAQPPTDSAGWEQRAATSFHGSNAPELSQLALGYALLMRKDFSAAVPVWKRIYESTNVNDMSTAYLYGWTLLETGHRTEAAPLLKLNPIPPPGLAPTFEAFYLPHLADWRKSSLRQ